MTFVYHLFPGSRFKVDWALAMKTDVTDVGAEHLNRSSDGALFLSYVRDSINNMYHGSLRQHADHVLHFHNQIIGSTDAGSPGSSTSSAGSSAVAGHSMMIVPSSNVTHRLWDDYQQHYDESAFDQPMYYGSSINKSNVSGDDLSENFSSPYVMLWPQRSAWISVFTLMLIVATVGNTLVAWIVLGQLFHQYLFNTILG